MHSEKAVKNNSRQLFQVLLRRSVQEESILHACYVVLCKVFIESKGFLS